MAPSERRASTTESSTIISIGELMQMEHHRIDEEKQQREKIRRDHEAAMRSARAQRVRELELEAKAAELARRAREQAEVEEAAALAGRFLGFIARAKVQAESEARELALELEDKRRVELERAKVDARRGVLRWALIAVSVGAVLTISGLVGTYAGIVVPEQERQVAALRSEVAAQGEQRSRLERDLDRERADKQNLQTQRAEIASQLAAATRRVEALNKQLENKRPERRWTTSTASTTSNDTGTPCLPSDPMCPLSGRL